jgi:uncharacterized protein YndB with AHSA1/START domain
MTEQTRPGAVVRREVAVDVPVDRAFDVVTRRLDAWWPHDSHHIGATPAIAVLEPRVGGRCFSLAEDGTQTDWGQVLTFDPPSRLVFAWMLTPAWQFEPDPARASEVEVTFTALTPARTEVVLTHGGFERYASGGDEMRELVDGAGGWGMLIDRYAQHATVADER